MARYSTGSRSSITNRGKAKFDKSFEKFKKDLRRTVRDRIEGQDGIGNRLAKALCRTFLDIAGSVLKRKATPNDTHSRNKINEIVDSMYMAGGGEYYGVREYIAKIPLDSEGLVMFLEFGTGLIGERQGYDSYSEKFQWAYAIHRSKYKTITNTESGNFGKTGWFFTNKNRKYVDKNDFKVHQIDILKRVIKRQVITPQRGNQKKSYVRYQPYNIHRKGYASVFSEGLKPIRYYYTAKQELNYLIRDLQAETGSRWNKTYSLEETMENRINKTRARYNLPPIKV